MVMMMPPLPKDEFTRRLGIAFDFLGELLQHPERIDDVPPVVDLFSGQSVFTGTPGIRDDFISARVGSPAEIVGALAPR